MKGLCHRDLKLENLLLDEKGEARAMASAVSCMRNG
jgi:serine/threonine protein kinase